nr:putative reverse transcriptase domain-containing protein [Tanacetum cinerariifolium]
MNLRRRGDRNGQKSKGEELENPFFEGLVFDDDPYEEEIMNGDVGMNLVFEDELEMGDDVFVLIGEEVAKGSEIPKAMFPLLEEFSDVFPDELPDALPPSCDIQHNIDLQPSLQLPNISVPKKVQDFVKGLRYHGDSSDNDLVRNSRTNFVYPWGNDEGPDDGVADDDYEEGLVFDDDPYEEEIMNGDVGVNLVFEDELEMGDDVFVLIGEEVAKGSEIPKAMFPLLEEFFDVFPDELPDALPPSWLPYHDDSSNNDLVRNSRTNFVYPWGNDEGPCIEERALLFLEAQDRVKKKA